MGDAASFGNGGRQGSARPYPVEHRPNFGLRQYHGHPHLRGLITVALGAPEPAAADADTMVTNEAEQRAAKRALWGWLNEWSEVARADIRRRDLLIQLGLAKRKKRNADSPTVGGEDGE